MYNSSSSTSFVFFRSDIASYCRLLQQLVISLKFSNFFFTFYKKLDGCVGYFVQIYFDEQLSTIMNSFVFDYDQNYLY